MKKSWKSANVSDRALAGVAIAFLSAFVGGGALADQVISKGTTLRGKITALDSAGIAFSPEYGTGSLSIRWEDIDNVETEGPFQVLYGDDGESNAPLRGVREGRLLTDSDQIDLESIHSGQPLGADGASLRDRMRSRWRYWDGSFEAGVNVHRATADSTGVVLALRAERAKAPTRFALGAGYRYGTQKGKGEERRRALDQILGSIRGEYALSPRIYGFVSGDATYDGIQRLSVRGVPRAGVGFVFWEKEIPGGRRDFVQADAGGAWVYERYFGGSDGDFASVASGLLASYHLPYGTRFDFKLDYLPNVGDFAGDYLLRGEAGLGVTLLDPFGIRISIIDEYDSTPAAEADQNSLYLSLALSVGW